jgi:hypothetical protein
MPGLTPEEPARKQFLAEVDLGFSMGRPIAKRPLSQCQINVHIDPIGIPARHASRPVHGSLLDQHDNLKRTKTARRWPS